MAVIPGDVQCIFSNRLDLFRACGLFVHGQQSVSWLGWLTRLAIVIIALFGAGSAGAGVAQPLEAIVRAMAVVPLNVHAGAGGDIDLDGFGIDDGHQFQSTTAG